MDLATTEVQARAPRERLRRFETAVLEVRRETPDTFTLVLDDFGAAPDYRAGQFLTIDPKQFDALKPIATALEQKKGKRELVRAYSMSSAPHEPLAITVKEEPFVEGVTEYPPLLSPFLVRMKPGDRMQVTGFAGSYVLPDDAEASFDHVIHVVAGSGAVPNFALVKDALHRGLELQHTIVASNKTWADVCFGEQLAALEREHPNLLRVIHTLTRERDDSVFCSERVCRGRISLDLFGRYVPDPERTLAYVCGPGITPWEKKAARERGELPTPRFLESAIAALEQVGIPKRRIHFEAYG